MGIIYLILHSLVLIFILVYFIMCICKKDNWKKLFIYEIFSIVITFIIMFYYSKLPHDGFAPGLMYFGEEFINLIAWFVYISFLVITLVTRIILLIIKKKNKK